MRRSGAWAAGGVALVLAGCEPDPDTATDTDSEVADTATASGALGGRVTAHGLPVADAFVAVGAAAAFTTEDGTFALAELPPGPVTVRVLAEGYAPAEVSAEVKAGEEARVEVALEAPNGAPVISSLSLLPGALRPGQEGALTASASDPDGDALTWQWTVDGAFAIEEGEPGTATLRAPSSPDEVGTVRVEVTDGHGGAAVATLSVSTTGNGAPAIVSATASGLTVAPGGELDFEIAAVDPDGDPLTYTWEAPAGWTLAPAGPVAKVTAPSASGEVGAVGVRVEDPHGGFATTAFPVATPALAGNNAPSIDALVADPPEVAPGGELGITVTASDADGDPLAYLWGPPEGWALSGTGASVTLTAPDAPGVTGAVYVRVDDGRGGATQGLLHVATTRNGPPLVALVVADPPSVLRGGEVALAAIAVDPDGDPLSYAWSAPPGWSVSGEAEAVLATPEVPGQAATIEVTVKDGRGGEATGSVDVATDPNRPPEVTGTLVTPPRVGPGQKATLSVTAEDPDGDPLEYAWEVSDTAWKLVDRGGGAAEVTAPSTFGTSVVAVVTVRDPWGGEAEAELALSSPLPSTCAEILASGQTTSGVYWLDVDGGDPSDAFQALCDMDGGGWTLVFKESAGTPTDPWTNWASGDRNVGDTSLLDRDREGSDYANSAITDGWSAFSEARVEVVTAGAVVHFLELDTVGADNASWFHWSRVAKSSWSDITKSSSNYNFFGVQGGAGRRFYINRTWGGCPYDTGWLIVRDAGGPPCAWEKANEILYAAPPTIQNWTTGSVGHADALLVWLR